MVRLQDYKLLKASVVESAHFVNILYILERKSIGTSYSEYCFVNRHV